MESIIPLSDEQTQEDLAEPPGPSGLSAFSFSTSFPLHGNPANTDGGRAGLPARTMRTPVLSERSRAFLRTYFPEASEVQWNDWRWQIKNRFRTREQIERVLRLSAAEAEVLERGKKGFPVAVTPYYMSLLDPDDPSQPLRRCVIPVSDEYETAPEERTDPLSEDRDSPVKGIVHRYPNRVLFLATDFCSTCCRYCTRSRLIGETHRECRRSYWDEAIRYIEQHEEVNDVVISGGDPLTLPTEMLEKLLARLRAVPHVSVIRLGTKVTTVLPQRITARLVNMIAKYHPVFMSIHVTHPDELTPEMKQACARLANAGMPIGSQTVLLKGINDDITTMRRLMMGLLSARVKPYYIYQCDPVPGSRHFRTSVQTGLDIIRGLRGHISGYAVPHYVVDAPGGGGKIPLLPNYVDAAEGSELRLHNYAGRPYVYPDVFGREGEAPCG